VLGEVPVALEVGHHPQHRYELLALLSGGVALNQLVLGQNRDAMRQHVDHLVAAHELLRCLAVPGQQRVGGTGDGLTDQGEDPHEQAVDLVEGSRRRFVELDHDPGSVAIPRGGRSDQGEVGSGQANPLRGHRPRRPRRRRSAALARA